MRSIVFLLMLLSATAIAQQQPVQMFRLYEENDLFTPNSTDRGYTNGGRLDFFYRRPQPGKSIFNSFLLKAGDNSINTYSWSVMQTMYTPENISTISPDPFDYPYSSALFISRALHSANPVKKYILQTEWIAGVMGKYAFGEQIQSFVHKHTTSPKPMGWDHQLSPALLINLNLRFEKSLVQKKFIEILYGSDVYIGTLQDGVKFHSTFRIGKMASYFSGYIEQYSSFNNTSRLKSYFTVRPALDIVLHNTMIEGNVFKRGIFTSDSQEKNSPVPKPAVNRFLKSIDIGYVIAYRGVGASFTYKLSSSDIHNLPAHAVGNISVYILL